MDYLVYQLLVIDEKCSIEGITANTTLQTSIAIRKVTAETKEEAIGKFVIDTSKEKFKRRVEPIECFEFDKLKQLQ